MSPGTGTRQQRVFAIFLDLVQISSESRSERGVFEYIRDFCDGLGLACLEDGAGRATGGECGNMVVRVPGGSFSSLKPIFLNAHMDTVEPGRGVVPIDAGDRFLSAGDTILGADCKAGIACILAAVEALVRSAERYRALDLVFTVQEELGLLGAKNLDLGMLDSSWGLVLDGSGPVGGVVREAPSRDAIHLRVMGRAAHAGIEPEKGLNAVECAARALSSFRSGRHDEYTTSNIGTIAGGVAANVVPDEAVVEAEVRGMSEGRMSQVREEVINLFVSECEESGCRFDFEVERDFEHFKLDESSAPLKIVIESIRDCGIHPFLMESGGGSDANILNMGGLVAVPVAIGLSEAHSKEEFILKEDLLKVSEMVCRVAVNASLEEERG